MLISSKDMLLKAQKEGYAVGAFNISNLETLKAVMEAAEIKRSPVILAISESSIGYAGLAYIYNLAKTAAELAKIPTAIHLDHGKTFEMAEKCLEVGFNSVMIDASDKPLAENIVVTKKVVDLAHSKKASCEGEIGQLGQDQNKFSKPEEIKEYVAKTGVDFVAVAVGTRHGYAPDEKIDVDLVAKIKEMVSVPLVLHGASGAKDEEVRMVIAKGVAKVNIHSELRMAFIEGLKQGLAENPQSDDFRKVLSYSVAKTQKIVENKIELFGSSGKI